jgi:Phycobilisome protein
MHSDLEIVARKAEFDYLQQPEIDAFKDCVNSLHQRLTVYECLRDKEIEIFQPIAEQLVEAFPDRDQKTLERALKHWLSILRYSAMAMLLNNPEFLQHRLLEWLAPTVQVHQLGNIESILYELLLGNLQQFLSKPQLTLLQPFLEQAKANIVNDRAFEASGV